MENNPSDNIESYHSNPLPNPPEVLKSTSKSLKIIVIILCFLVVGGIGAYFFMSNGSREMSRKIPVEKTTTGASKLASNTIVYGYWEGANSYINSYDLSTLKSSAIAILPSNIKHVKVISPTKLVYIAKTNDRDHGSELVVRTLGNQNETVIFSAEEGFGIDDYAISPNGNYVAVWQIAMPPDSLTLRGALSRVTTMKVDNPTQKHLIYDEISTTPVHYPIAVLNNGDLYSDRFLPNNEAGWAYGMSYSNFSGSTKEEISQMASGTYSTQPSLSPDGNSLVFSGYDGSDGVGTMVTSMFRRGIANPNTVEIMDLATKKRTKIASSENGIFPSSSWDITTGNVLYSYISKNSTESGEFSYNPVTTKSTQLLTTGVLSSLTGGSYLTMDMATGEDSLGNLGGKYAPAYTAFYVQKINGEKIKVEAKGEYMQLIDLRRDRYFASSINAEEKLGKEQKGKQLSLKSVSVKPELASKRIAQQSGGRCRDVAVAQCNALFGTNYLGDDVREPGFGVINIEPEFLACFQKQLVANKAIGACSDSPLYLYGKEGLSVKVDAGTILYSPNVPYSQSGFEIELQKNGFVANGVSVDSLIFDYKPTMKINRPDSGIIVPSRDIEHAIASLGRGLDLNSKELEDTILYAKSAVASPFVFLSVFDRTTSHKILPLYFDPVPESYSNIVFYLENINDPGEIVYELPSLEKVERVGFTAVEISFIVR